MKARKSQTSNSPQQNEMHQLQGSQSSPSLATYASPRKNQTSTNTLLQRRSVRSSSISKYDDEPVAPMSSTKYTNSTKVNPNRRGDLTSSTQSSPQVPQSSTTSSNMSAKASTLPNTSIPDKATDPAKYKFAILTRTLVEDTVFYSTPKELQTRHYWIRALRRISLTFLVLYFFASIIFTPFTFRFLSSTLQQYFPGLVDFFQSCSNFDHSPSGLGTPSLESYQLTWYYPIICAIYLSFATNIMPFVGKVPFWGACVFAAIAVICSKLYNETIVCESIKLAKNGVTMSKVRLGGRVIDRFIPREAISVYAINEGFTKCRVLFYIFFIIKEKNEDEIVVPFQDVLPPLNDLIVLLREIEKTYGIYDNSEVSLKSLL